MYKTEDFDIQVPRSMVAQEPASPRDSSRLLVFDRKTGKIEHRTFRDLVEYLKPEDILVFNNSRVIPARLKGNKDPMEPITIVLLNQTKNQWEVLVEVGELRLGDIVGFGSSGLQAEVLKVGDKIGKRTEHLAMVRFNNEDLLESSGELPLPPYIHSYKGDPERYQTVYSRIRGSSAAPTAGLHFTDELLDKIVDKGCYLEFVTLHVGIDTFMPVLEEKPEEHKMYKEWCIVREKTAAGINDCKEAGGRCICVGTTSARTIETASQSGKLRDYSNWTQLYILPGQYTWKTVDCMVTNFHYPKSTNIMMIASFMGLDNLKRCYEEAVKEKYRFYSFGDCMLII